MGPKRSGKRRELGTSTPDSSGGQKVWYSIFMMYVPPLLIFVGAPFGLWSWSVDSKEGNEYALEKCLPREKRWHEDDGRGAN